MEEIFDGEENGGAEGANAGILLKGLAGITKEIRELKQEIKNEHAVLKNNSKLTSDRNSSPSRIKSTANC